MAKDSVPVISILVLLATKVLCATTETSEMKTKTLAPTTKLAILASFVMNPVLARVTEVYPSESRLVRKVVLLVTQSGKKEVLLKDPFTS